MDEPVWQAAYDMARRARTKGITVPVTDVAIAACAFRHGTALETADSDFELLASVSLVGETPRTPGFIALPVPPLSYTNSLERVVGGPGESNPDPMNKKGTRCPRQPC